MLAYLAELNLFALRNREKFEKKTIPYTIVELLIIILTIPKFSMLQLGLICTNADIADVYLSNLFTIYVFSTTFNDG